MTHPRPTGRRGARRLATGLTAAAALAVTAVLPAGGALADPAADRFLGTAPQYGVTAPDAESGTSATGAWFVQLAGEPVARGGNRAAATRGHQAFVEQARAKGASFEVRDTYEKVWNGLSVSASDGDIDTIRTLRDVVAVFPVATVEAPTPDSLDEPAMSSALAMTGADIAQNELGLDGEGIKVAVIDSGVDYDHPDFGGNGTNGSTSFPTERVAYGYDFVGDDYNADRTAAGYQPVPRPDADPDDCQGHGTHVAGIVGADGDVDAGGVRGVAPAVTLGAYRVFGCEGSTTADIIVAALERAYDDGMDIINMSLGAGFITWPQYPTAAASDALVDDGVVVVASIGNSGANGTWSAGAPGVGEKVIGVASFDNTRFEARAFELSDGTQVAYSPGSDAPGPPTSGTLPVSRTGTPATPNDACPGTTVGDLSGTAALIQRGDCTFHEKALAAQQAGAAAVVLYNNAPGSFSPSLAGTPEITVPVVAVSREDGVVIDALVAGEGTTLTWTDEDVSVENPTGGLISSFSSYGMTAELDLKPDLGAPGGLIRSTYPLEKQPHAVLSGTSMSAPHVAGNVAQLLQARPDLGAEDVRPVLQNHAVPALWSLNAGLGYLEPAHRQGAGMVDIAAAVQSTTGVVPGKLSLGESEAGPATETLTVTNTGDEAVTYTVSSVDAIATGGATNAPGFYLPEATVEAPEQVTVPAGGSTDVTVTITAPASPDKAQYGGYLVLTPAEGDTLRVPFAGFIGDYQSIVAMTDGQRGLPELAQLTACDRLIGIDCTRGASWELRPDGGTYSMTDGDVPTMLIHLEHPVRSLTYEAFRANPDGSKGRPAHARFSTAQTIDYLGRDGTANGFRAYTWDGTFLISTPGTEKRQTLGNGRYVLEVTALKAGGDPGNPDHVETWLTPVITIDRG